MQIAELDIIIENLTAAPTALADEFCTTSNWVSLLIFAGPVVIVGDELTISDWVEI